MSHSVPIMNVHGVEEFYVDFVPAADREVLRVVARHVSPGEIDDMQAVMPAALRELFPD